MSSGVTWAERKKKVQMLYARAPKEDEILAFTMGKGNAKTVRNLMIKLKQLTIDWFVTDDGSIQSCIAFEKAPDWQATHNTLKEPIPGSEHGSED